MNTLFAALALFAAIDLGSLFGSKDSEGWEMTAVDFAVDHAREGFKFASEKRDIVNCLNRKAALWLEREVWETRIYYAPGAGAKRLELSLYNRGDAQRGDEFRGGDLDQLIDDICRRCADGAKTPPIEKKKLRTGGFQYECTWTKADPTVNLAWGAAGNRRDSDIQYVRITLTPKTASKPKGAQKTAKTKSLATLAKERVKKNADGDVWVDGVPMVDQGQKGYCAAAVSERILRYYGHDIDEHQIAQMAGSTAKGGTNIRDMKEAIRAVGSKCHLGFSEIVSLSGSIGDIEKEIDMYNKAAKSMKEPELSLSQFTRGNMINVGAIHDAMKPKVLKKMRMKDSRFKKFLAGVKAQVDKGIPVCWGVTLGLFPEPGVNMQSSGGHMRMIIGYNLKTHEILYTDTWGAGHELKRMPEDWAFTITHDAFFLKPL